MCWLEEPLDAGPHVWSIDAPAHCGWRTCWSMLARERAGGWGLFPSTRICWRVRCGASGGRYRKLAVDASRSLAPRCALHRDVERDGATQARGAGDGGRRASLGNIGHSRCRERGSAAPARSFASSRSLPSRSRDRSGPARRGLDNAGSGRSRPKLNGRPGASSRPRSAASCKRESGASVVVHERPPAGSNLRERRSRQRPSIVVLARVEALEARGRHAAARRHLRRERAALDRRGQTVAGLQLWAALAIREVRDRIGAAPSPTGCAPGSMADARGDPRVLLEAIPRVAHAWIRDAAVIAGRAPAPCRDRGGCTPRSFTPPPMLTLLLAESLVLAGPPRRRCAPCSPTATHVLATGSSRTGRAAPGRRAACVARCG